jgi:fluoride exporter
VDIADVLWVGLAGSLGALTRFAVDIAVRARVTRRVPLGTLVINLTGSLILGLVAGFVLFHSAPGRLEVVAGTGFCGGYTTFSTASFETVRLAQQGDLGAAVLNTAGNVLGTLGAAALGLSLAAL